MYFLKNYKEIRSHLSLLCPHVDLYYQLPSFNGYHNICGDML